MGGLRRRHMPCKGPGQEDKTMANPSDPLIEDRITALVSAILLRIAAVVMQLAGALSLLRAWRRRRGASRTKRCRPTPGAAG